VYLEKYSLSKSHPVIQNSATDVSKIQAAEERRHPASCLTDPSLDSSKELDKVVCSLQKGSEQAKLGKLQNVKLCKTECDRCKS